MSISRNEKHAIPSPKIAKFPSTCSKRLIDEGLLFYEASLAGFAERYGRGETSHTIHVWWARRPHTAMRALVFASLCKDSGIEAEKILGEVGVSNSLSDPAINIARKFLSKQYKDKPKILDMFGGGGTIPFEALNLGAKAFTIDTNRLSVFIQKCNLVYSQFLENKNIQFLLKESGARVLRQLRRETDLVYPLRNPGVLELGRKSSVFGYIWTYSTKCEKCGYKFFLTKRPWLSRKKGKNIALVVENGPECQKISIQTVKKDYKFQSVWIGRNGKALCPKCRHIQKKVDVRNCEDEMVAMICFSEGKKKDYIYPNHGAISNNEILNKKEKDSLKSLGVNLPESKLPIWSGIVNPAIYGIKTHSDFLNQRQRTVLLLLIKCLRDEFIYLKKKTTEKESIYIISLLGSLIDQLVDWNSRLSMWIPQNEQVGRGFCGPGISMLWDYAEIDPLSAGPSNLSKKLQRIIKGSFSIKKFPNSAVVKHANAQELPFEDNFFDCIVTDPPYYDNLYYSALADFFYAWKRLLFLNIDSDLFKMNSTDTSMELVASAQRNGSPLKAHEIYCAQLEKAINEAERVLKTDGVLSFIYSHSSLNGWDALIKAFRPSNFIITSVQPLSIERKQRPRAMTSQAVNTCITFVARKSKINKNKKSSINILNKLESICNTGYITNLIRWGWSEFDAALAMFAQGVGMIANSKKIIDKSDIEVMILIERIIKKTIPSFKVVKRKSL
jgi:putative DNA methylase